MYGGGGQIRNLVMHHESLTFSFKYSTLGANTGSPSKSLTMKYYLKEINNYSNVVQHQDIIFQSTFSYTFLRAIFHAVIIKHFDRT